jgi:lysylphosphatidylglycerol synthetase-like protein (DUF2156 family)
MIYALFFGGNFSEKNLGWWAQFWIVFIYVTDWWYIRNIKKTKDSDEKQGKVTQTPRLIAVFGKKGEPTPLARIAGILGLASAFGFALAFNLAGNLAGKDIASNFYWAFGILAVLIVLYTIFQFFTNFTLEFVFLLILSIWLILLSFFSSPTKESDYGFFLSIATFSIVLIYTILDACRVCFPWSHPSN